MKLLDAKKEMLAEEAENLGKVVDEKANELENGAMELGHVKSIQAEQAFIIQSYQEEITILNLRSHQLQNLATEYAMKFLTHQSKIESQISNASTALDNRTATKAPRDVENKDEDNLN